MGRGVYIIALAVVLAFLLDYVHVVTMSFIYPGLAMEYPTPMLYIFILLTAPLALYLLSRQPKHVERVVAQLLKEPERSLYLKIYERGEVAEVAKELGLTKVRAWRAVQRLKDKGLIELEKKAGRLVARVARSR